MGKVRATDRFEELLTTTFVDYNGKELVLYIYVNLN